jgi:hypothetical protein
VLGTPDVRALKTALVRIRNGSLDTSGIYPVSYQISDDVNLFAEPAFLQNWELTYPALTIDE